MKKLLLALFVVLLYASSALAQSCTTIGAKDCIVTSKGSCHWWICTQTASQKQWIFSGKSCTCPRAELDIPGFMPAALVLTQIDACDNKGINKSKMIEAIQEGVPEARMQDPQ